jgi:septal ring factor EnvC (AmiA/AmiB activator)
MLEALSLSVAAPDHPGRWTEPVQPAGFEALAGVQPVVRTASSESASASREASAHLGAASSAALRHAERKEAQRLEAERKRLEAEVRDAEKALARTREAETRAREMLDQAIDNRHAAETALAAARKALDR